MQSFDTKLTNIAITDDIIVYALKWISHNSALGIDVVPKINLSLKEGIIPAQCKEAAIVPVF